MDFDLSLGKSVETMDGERIFWRDVEIGDGVRYSVADRVESLFVEDDERVLIFEEDLGSIADEIVEGFVRKGMEVRRHSFRVQNRGSDMRELVREFCSLVGDHCHCLMIVGGNLLHNIAKIASVQMGCSYLCVLTEFPDLDVMSGYVRYFGDGGWEEMRVDSGKSIYIDTEIIQVDDSYRFSVLRGILMLSCVMRMELEVGRLLGSKFSRDADFCYLSAMDNLRDYEDRLLVEEGGVPRLCRSVCMFSLGGYYLGGYGEFFGSVFRLQSILSVMLDIYFGGRSHYDLLSLLGAMVYERYLLLGRLESFEVDIEGMVRQVLPKSVWERQLTHRLMDCGLGLEFLRGGHFCYVSREERRTSLQHFVYGLEGLGEKLLPLFSVYRDKLQFLEGRGKLVLFGDLGVSIDDVEKAFALLSFESFIWGLE